MGRGANSGSVTLEIDPGVRVPAALLKSDTPLPPIVARAKEQIAEDFVREITEATNKGVGGKDLDTVVDAARNRADSRFRSIFGYDAYNAFTMQAAREALESSKK